PTRLPLEDVSESGKLVVRQQAVEDRHAPVPPVPDQVTGLVGRHIDGTVSQEAAVECPGEPRGGVEPNSLCHRACGRDAGGLDQPPPQQEWRGSIRPRVGSALPQEADQGSPPQASDPFTESLTAHDIDPPPWFFEEKCCRATAHRGGSAAQEVYQVETFHESLRDPVERGPIPVPGLQVSGGEAGNMVPRRMEGLLLLGGNGMQP